MLANLLSEDAHDLYDRLVAAGGRPVDQIPDHEMPVLEDLLRQGLVFRTAGPAARFCAVPPLTAMLRLLDHEQQQVLRAHRRLIDRYTELERLERRFPATTGGLELLVDAEAAASVAADLVTRARDDCRLIHGAHLGLLDAPATTPATRDRRLVDVSVFEEPATPARVARMAAAGVELRLLPRAPAPMLVADAAALVRTGPLPHGVALLIRGGELVSSFARLFDLLWDGAAPLDDTRPADGPSAVQLRILRMAGAGLKDEAIARAMGRSVRWVRRHFELLEESLGATNRLTLGIAAARRNWV